MEFKAGGGIGQSARISRHILLELHALLSIANSEPTAGINVIDSVSIGAQLANKFSDSSRRLRERSNISDLRPDMNADSCHLQIPHPRGLRVKSARTYDGHSELVFVQAGRNIRMRVSRHVRIHTKCDARDFPQLGGALGQSPDLPFPLPLDQQTPAFQRRSHLAASLAHAGEDGPVRGAAADRQYPLQLSAGNYVKPASLPPQQSQKP